MGDFYETFDEDARLFAKELEITLTSRSMGKNLRVPMAGVPAHSVESYLARLVKKRLSSSHLRAANRPGHLQGAGGPGRGPGCDAGNGPGRRPPR